jgi:UDP-N-acetylglucosamine acyltransferase
MAVEIHPTAIVSEKAKIGTDVSIGPYSIIGPDVQLGDGCKIHPHVVMDGIVEIGTNNEFYPFCSIGAPPQDLSYKGEPSKVQIGDNNVFRESISIHRGTPKEDMLTKVGNDCFLMAYVHLGHDVQVGDNVIIANNVHLAGHVKVGDRSTIGGVSCATQFCSLGRGSYIGAGTVIDKDIPPFSAAYGNRATLRGINIIGLRRNGFAKAQVSEIVDFFRSMESSSLSPSAFIENAEAMKDYQGSEFVSEFSTFIKKSKVGLAAFAS